MKLKFFPLLIGTLFFTSCSNPNPKTNVKNETISVILPYHVDLEKNLNNVSSIPLSSIGKELEYIPLETSTNSLIKRIDQIVFTDSYIFISDFNKLLQFDRSGKFIRQVGSNGRGPAEYIYVMGFCVDENHRKIDIIDYANHLVKEFDFDGQFIKHFKIPFESPQLMVSDSTSLIFNLYNGTRVTNDSDYSLFITNNDGNPIKKIKKRLIRKSTNGLNATVMPLYFFNDSIRFLEFGVDTLFTLKSDSLETYAIFNLGKMKMEPDVSISTQSFINKDEVYTRLSKTLWIHNVIEDRHNIYLKLDYGLTDSSEYGVFNKFSNESNILKEKAFFNDLDSGLTFWPKYIYKDSILIDYVDAFNLLNLIHKMKSLNSIEKNNSTLNQFENLTRELTETSNPVLIVLK